MSGDNTGLWVMLLLACRVLQRFWVIWKSTVTTISLILLGAWFSQSYWPVLGSKCGFCLKLLSFSFLSFAYVLYRVITRNALACALTMKEWGIALGKQHTTPQKNTNLLLHSEEGTGRSFHLAQHKTTAYLLLLKKRKIVWLPEIIIYLEGKGGWALPCHLKVLPLPDSRQD